MLIVTFDAPKLTVSTDALLNPTPSSPYSFPGAFWFGGLAVYGLGVYRMGDFGTVVGWPLLMGTIIVTSNVTGVLTGEWKGAGARVRGYLVSGMIVILVALWILSLAQKS